MSFQKRVFLGAVGAELAAFITLSSGAAEAASTHTTRRTWVGGDVRWWISENGGSVFPIVPFFHYEVVTGVFLDFDWPIAPQDGGRTFTEPYQPKSRFGLGNPMLGAHVAS